MSGAGAGSESHTPEAERWLVAMSGGVDSSVAAALLVQRGHDVVGVTMDLGAESAAQRAPGPEGSARSDELPVLPSERTPGRCCGLPDAEDARGVARTLGIRHYVANYREPFRTSVIEPFLDEYAAGRTPIPCVACNRVLKFDLLLRRARALGARGVATGHYARVAPGPDGGLGLYRGRDRDKDQSYFLFDLPREALAGIDFPLGACTKSEVREIARSLHLGTADKPESQGICFVPDGDVRGALEQLRPGMRGGPGAIVDEAGRRLGDHAGAVGYTLGQRKGLGLSGGPWYVTGLDPAANRVRVGRAQEVRQDAVRLESVSWLDGVAPATDVRVQIRHRHQSVSAEVEPLEGGAARIRFREPVWAPAPGQAAVAYDAADERVLGGGWIAGG